MPPNARPERDRARQLYVESGGKTSANEIADVMGVPRPTVQSWKRRDGWDAQLDGKPPRAKGRKRNGQPRLPALPQEMMNDAYKKLKYDSFTESEQQIVELIPYDPLVQQKILIVEFEIRERRMYAHLRNMYDKHQIESENGMVLSREIVSAYVKKDEENRDSKDIKSAPQSGTVTKVKQPAMEMILALEEALTKIQKLKQDAINNLHRMETSAITLEYERRKLMATEARVNIEKECHAVDTSGRDVENLIPIAQMLISEEHHSGDH